MAKIVTAEVNPYPVSLDESSLGFLKGYIGIPLRLANRSVLDQVDVLLAQTGIAPAEFAVLAVIEANPNAVIGDIGRLLGIQKSNFTPLIAGLQKRGLIKRTASNVDARRQHVSLSTAGKKVLARGKRLHDSLEAHLTTHLGRSAHSQMVKLLYRLANIPMLTGEVSSLNKHRRGRYKLP